MFELWILGVAVILYIGIVAHLALYRADSVRGWTTLEDSDTKVSLELLYDRLKEIHISRKSRVR